mgnify:CR=1 FL=1
MEQYTYLEIKEDIASIIQETMDSGSSLEGSIGRAEREYWLVDQDIDLAKPTPFPLKLIAAISICAIKSENSIDLERSLLTIDRLLELITQEEIRSLKTESVPLLINDASTVLADSAMKKLVVLFEPVT